MIKQKSINIKFLGIIFFVVLNVCPVYAQDQNDLIDRLIERSGIYEQVDLLSSQLQAQMQEWADSGLQKAESLPEILSQFSKSDALKDKIRNKFNASISMEDAQEVLKWYESPLALRITQLEKQTATPEAMMAMQQQAENLYSQTQRVEMIQKLDVATKATDASMKMVEDLTIVTKIRSTPGVSIEEISSQAREDIEQYRDEYKKMTILSFLYAYQNLTDEELAQYIGFAESDLGQRYNKAVMDTLGVAFADILKLVYQELSVER